MRVLKILAQLDGAADWRAVVAQERAAMAVAAAVRTSMPGKAAWVNSTLGRAYRKLGNFSKALEHHKEHLTMAKELGDRAEEGGAYGNLGNAYQSQGDFSKVIIEYHTQHLAIAKGLADWAGKGIADGDLGNGYHSQGGCQAIKYHTQHLAIAKDVPPKGMYGA